MKTGLVVVDPSERLVKTTEFEDFVTRKNEERDERDKTIGKRNRQRRSLVLRIASVYYFFQVQARLDMKEMELSEFEIGEKEILRRAKQIKKSQVVKESIMVREIPAETRSFFSRIFFQKPKPSSNLEPRLSVEEELYLEFDNIGYFSFLRKGSMFGYKGYEHLFINNDCRERVISNRIKGCTECRKLFGDYSFGGGFLGSGVREILISRELWRGIENEWE